MTQPEIPSAKCRILAAALALAVLATSPRGVAAFSIGFTGASGKQGQICNQCHMGGTPPLVRFEGPATVVAGTSATFRFVIESQGVTQRHAGFNVASSAGTLAVISGQGAQSLAQELTHTAPKMADDAGVVTYEFLWSAPLVSGPQTLFGAGNSVNRNFGDTGDRAASTTLAVDVVDPASPTPTATPTASPTASPTPPPVCAGDCDGGGETNIDDLVVAVDLAASGAGTELCTAADANRDGRLSIDELIGAVAAALAGCTP